MTRVGHEAAEWASKQITSPSQNWYRLCKMFVRLAFNVPSDGTPDAGSAWDRAQHRHRTENPLDIPPFVPVFWELPSIADHVALSTMIPGGCISNDYYRPGYVDRVAINDITRGWGGRLLGWTEDIDGVRVWTPPRENPETPNITAFFEANNLEDRIKFLKRIKAHGEPKMANLAERLLTSYERRERTNDLIGDLRKELRRLEEK